MLRWIAIAALVVSPAASAQTLSKALADAVGGRSGTAVVLSVESGKILAGYRPQVAAQRVTRPGSTVKPFVLLELLQSGKVAGNTEWTCRRRVRVGAHHLDCQHVRPVEAMNAERGLAYSCNSYFTEMGARLTDTELTNAFRRAGFGNATHLMNTEASGYVRPAAMPGGVKLKVVGEDGITVTPLQMAAAYRELALEIHRERKMPSPLPSDGRRHGGIVIAGLRGAVKYGTAQGAQVEAWDVAGKTGTSSAEEGAWTHAWFAGFAPAGKPEIVVVVFLERGHGSEAAGIAGAILKEYARGRR